MKVWPGLRVPAGDLDRIVTRLFLTHGDRQRNLTNFWVLLTLAAVIASAGVVADSTATVIGAMIVAPLMTPILGTALAIVLADRRQLVFHLGLTLAGAAAVVAVGYLLGTIIHMDVTAATNSQVASRVSPRLIDLLAALATGLVGGFALIRSDVSDTLPGVAIAISLVPPLAVVGLTAESGAYSESVGALLLFGTNVAAIIATGTAIMVAARLQEAARAAGLPVGTLGRKTVATVGLALLLVAVPLGYGSWQVLREQQILGKAQPVAQRWAAEEGWQLTDLQVRRGILQVVAIGRPPEADQTALREDLDTAGLSDVEAVVTLVIGGSKTLPPG
ncbi:membrane protein [Actinoplanes sp. OR16]|uniref:DUF389 domain-containing protein n=1 Tax=Actinoplanes sp. OR16 TaxID=946334 RepID=UPI000F6FD378|nr:DUF389 domain-containing protein [Actinoplanes sp. OR16]BBH67923.1 membrane protein [Actinoplanes sp. OR16]